MTDQCGQVSPRRIRLPHDIKWVGHVAPEPAYMLAYERCTEPSEPGECLCWFHGYGDTPWPL